MITLRQLLDLEYNLNDDQKLEVIKHIYTHEDTNKIVYSYELYDLIDDAIINLGYNN